MEEAKISTTFQMVWECILSTRIFISICFQNWSDGGWLCYYTRTQVDEFGNPVSSGLPSGMTNTVKVTFDPGSFPEGTYAVDLSFHK